MVGPWMLCVNGWGLSGRYHGWPMDALRARMGLSGRYHGSHMDALREWMEADLDAIMVGTWMLCGNGRSLIWTLSAWLAHGCSAGMDGV